MSALHLACAADNVVLVSILLEQGASVNGKDKHGRTPLHIASARGNKLLVELLLQRGANPRATSHNGKIPLDCSADETMATLLAKVLVRAGQGELARERLLLLPILGDKARQKILKEVDRLATGTRSPPPFLSNLLGKSKSIVSMIWSREDGSPRSSTSSVEDYSSAESGIAEMESRTDAGFNTSVESVRTAASSGFASECKHKPCRRSVTTPLTSQEFAAIKQIKDKRSASDPPSPVKLSRTQSARPKRSNTITHGCLSRSRRYPKKVSFPSDVLLEVAVVDDDFVEACHLIKSRKVDINRFSANGLSPLHRAAVEGSYECLQLLLAQGANVDVKDGFGWTPLHDAVFHGHVNCATVLIHGGADVEAETNNFQTPLLLANDDDLILAIGQALVAKESGDNCSELLPKHFQPAPDPDRETCVWCKWQYCSPHFFGRKYFRWIEIIKILSVFQSLSGLASFPGAFPSTDHK